MADDDEGVFEAKVTRYDISRLRLAQLLVPLAVIATVLSRRVPTPVTQIAAAALLGIGLAVLISAARRLGWQPLRFEGNAVTFGGSGLRVERKQIREWTLLGGIARLYGGEMSFKLQARPGSEAVFGSLLRSQFGSPTALERRGSKRARLLAVCGAIFGLVASVFAIVNDDPMLAVVGAPALVFGIAVFGALSQRMRSK